MAGKFHEAPGPFPSSTEVEGEVEGVSKQRYQGFRDSLGYIDILDQPGRHRPRRNALGQHHQLHEAKMETEASGGCPLLSLYCN